MVLMEGYTISILPRAKKDIISTADYIKYELLQADIAKQFAFGVMTTIGKLKEFPYRCKLVRDQVLSNMGVRCVRYRNYYVFYIVIEESKDITILRVTYYRRNWSRLI